MSTNLSVSETDLRAAVQAGMLTEAQAANLKGLAGARSAERAAMRQDDEPFEFFRGFSEIFISIGLVILLGGLVGLITLVGGPGIAIFLPLITAAITWWWAGYFARKRRMTLPSMVLTIAFATAILIAGVTLMLQLQSNPLDISRTIVAMPLLATTLAMVVWYRHFRLPFSMFVLGGSALLTLYSLVAADNVVAAVVLGNSSHMGGLFDLRQSPVFALATLVFGICAFLAGMWFDMQDPHRLGRHSATAFWLHLLAAPALVNTVALTLYNTGGNSGMLLLILALAVITLLALVIDRRSFLSAAIAYIALVITWIIGEGGSLASWTIMLLILGGLITAIGTWWVQLRARVMWMLPDFPGKSRLSPYSRPE